MPLPRFIVLCLVLAIIAVSALAAPPRPASPSPEKEIGFIEYDLANGLHVILHQDRSAPVIATYVLYHVGSKDERPDRTGFAHFFEHLMFEGSENIPRDRIDKLISGAGGNLNASTSFDLTDYYFNVPSNQLALALWIESERMLHAKVDETGVETQRQVVAGERFGDKYLRRAVKPPELFGGNQLGGRPVAVRAALLDLGENDQLTLLGDQVDLCAAHGVVFRQYAVAVGEQVISSDLLSPVPH